MHDALSGVTLFKLRIQIDQDGVGWSHLFGTSHQLTVDELPRPLRRRTTSLIRLLAQQGIRILEIRPSIFPKVDMNGVMQELPEDFPETSIETLYLLAWWMEWQHRFIIGQERDRWYCPECGGGVTLARGHCNDSECVSWNVLRLCTGEPTLHLVPNTSTHETP